MEVAITIFVLLVLIFAFYFFIGLNKCSNCGKKLNPTPDEEAYGKMVCPFCGEKNYI